MPCTSVSLHGNSVGILSNQLPLWPFKHNTNAKANSNVTLQHYKMMHHCWFNSTNFTYALNKHEWNSSMPINIYRNITLHNAEGDYSVFLCAAVITWLLFRLWQKTEFFQLQECQPKAHHWIPENCKRWGKKCFTAKQYLESASERAQHTHTE